MKKRFREPFSGRSWKRVPGTLFLTVALASCGPRHVNLTPSAPSPTVVLQKDLSALFEAPEFQHSLWSVLVQPVSSEQPLYSLNPSKLVMPGSNMKLLTLAAAVDRLGWDYRFDT